MCCEHFKLVYQCKGKNLECNGGRDEHGGGSGAIKWACACSCSWSWSMPEGIGARGINDWKLIIYIAPNHHHNLRTVFLFNN